MSSPSGHVYPHPITREQRWERNREMVRLCTEEGLSPEELSGRFGLRLSTVFVILLRYGVSLRRNTRHPQELVHRNQEIARLYGEGLTPEELAAQFGVGRWTVCETLRKQGISLRRVRRRAVVEKQYKMILRFRDMRIEKLKALLKYHRKYAHVIKQVLEEREEDGKAKG